ncbi:glycosyltransferase family 4 protein [Acidithrix ferrooxidans]|uniref:Capsular glucan synthase n=1 Tax=Acidithrix ferrooxidans TaxID=1280514 RepID=A0A0D8HL58_9ACTN|nr:glycosyltransferase family 4 protein [Acidithrix ferrooxidans]KJF18740.1 capsular glucan synthase [Acidithrix ferrooxidans]
MHSSKFRVTFVVPRYGKEVFGGAENAARMLAEALATREELEVNVLTTTALSHLDWSNNLPPGSSLLNNVSIERFSIDAGRRSDFEYISRRMLSAPKSFSRQESLDLINWQGPVSNQLIESIATCDSDVVVFYPYLYHTTVQGVLSCPVPSVLHPAAHDEPIIDLAIYRDVFAKVQGLVYHTYAERAIVERRFGVASKKSIDLGMGFRTYEGLRGNVCERSGLNGKEFILCLGRVEAKKGSVLLARLFHEYKVRNRSGVQLVFAGAISEAGPEFVDVRYLGEVSEADKAELLEKATIVISPSAYESFGIVLLEAWNASKAVIVNRDCAATYELARSSRGALSFEDYGTFEESLHVLLENRKYRDLLAKNGKRYIRQNFSWDVLAKRYLDFLRSVARV